MLADKGVDPHLAGRWCEWPWLPHDAALLSIEAFTDGAADVSSAAGRAVGTSGWGLLVLAAAEVPGAGRVTGMVGAQCGPVCIDEAAVGFCGALRPTAQVAELTAAAAALSLPLAREDLDLAATSMVVRSD